MGRLLFSSSGGALFFYFRSKLGERTSAAITADLSFGEQATVFNVTDMTAALLDRLTNRCHLLETGNDSYRFRQVRMRQRKKDGAYTCLDPS